MPRPSPRHRKPRALPRWLLPGGAVASAVVVTGAAFVLPVSQKSSSSHLALFDRGDDFVVPPTLTNPAPDPGNLLPNQTTQASTVPTTVPAPSATRVAPTTRPAPSAAPRRSAPPRQAEPADHPSRSAPPAASSLQARIYGVALGYVGKGGPYVYGGKSLVTGSDCSYLVFRILQDAGLSVPYRASGALRATYRAVPASQARAGDLVWRLGHVGVYDGRGGVIDHGSGFGAKHRPLWYSPVYLRVTV